MPRHKAQPGPPETHQDWVRLRTLIYLRWIAIAGQLAAILIAYSFFNIALDLPLCFATVGAAVAANLIAIFSFPDTKRLTQPEAAATLMFDMAQLAILLAITGGLSNPFALLILVPVTIAATALKRSATIALGLSTMVMISLVALVYLPLMTRDGEVINMPPVFEFGYWLAIVIGVAFLGAYAHTVSNENRSMSEALRATQLALAREQKLTDLGGVVAAAAHELGTPLATIKLVSAELADELGDREDLRDDALLIREQADRCRDILHSMGRAGKDDLHLRSAPLMAVLREAADPHQERGIDIRFEGHPIEEGAERQPTIYRYPELIHALRNFVQNAVDFARTTVWIEAEWDAEMIRVRVSDDGRGYPSNVLSRIGDPYLQPRANASERKEYDGMGLGVFIAKTLLERTGAQLAFFNGDASYAPLTQEPQRSGAVVEVSWPAERILAPESAALGLNAPITG
ncbi:ActS/PrrB/RegB family redox-sensitive histidine kinase [Thioclava sp. BHET1]|uniref:histidine kinase n=1 Tax=Thioclava dalianensis TaxID=1185766 RepID=A0A074TF11_9RHOB|nr:ActS/PrrB/RegB family redox-sensitive histidine kinase [Thioclava dalianensis]KEP70321.1 histidine kinase [Thioclava dalianensis]TMV94098.1 ActS/PrrB/RegB family redox-sensitive histidine kinase [Thioclava sp. BHET1]SFN33453.1 two-component system, sensor histidine kinase RegB [Thioclava dalianensis]